MDQEVEFEDLPDSPEEIGDFKKYLDELRLDGLTWKQIAVYLDITTGKLDWWRKKNDYDDSLRNVTCYPQKLVDQLRQGLFRCEALPHEMMKLLDEYKALSLTWKQFAVSESVDLQWLRAWRKNYDYDELYDDLEDEELDERVASYMKDHPRRGEVMVNGCLRADELRVPRQRLRDSLNRVDPEGRQERKSKTVKRREYNVPGPHHLWHLDGHHKMKRYHLVTHAAIDGFTRLCTFARCNDNNEASTVLQDFQVGVREFGCPSRVRTDKGGENVDVGIFMCMQRGCNRGSIIMGRSTHNQRIERFWRDLKKEVVDYYISVFSFLEHEHGVDFMLESHIFCVHFLFVPRINEDLKLFQDRWNHHSLRTEKNKSPLQLQFLNRHVNAGITHSELPHMAIDELTYGLDGDDSDDDVFQREDVEHGRPRITALSCPLSDAGFDYFISQIRPLTLGDHDASLFVEHFTAAIHIFDIAITL